MYRGGDGVARELEFQSDMHVGILSEPRVIRLLGMAGMEYGGHGLNLWILENGLTVDSGRKNQCIIKVGDRTRNYSPRRRIWCREY